MKPRFSSNGLYAFYPKRGADNPPAPEGYERLQGHTHSFILCAEPCIHRTEKLINTACCQSFKTLCAVLDSEITRLDCQGCAFRQA